MKAMEMSKADKSDFRGSERKWSRPNKYNNLQGSYNKYDKHVVIGEQYCRVEISSPLGVCEREMVVCSLQESMPLSSPPVVREICVCLCELMNVSVWVAFHARTACWGGCKCASGPVRLSIEACSKNNAGLFALQLISCLCLSTLASDL